MSYKNSRLEQHCPVRPFVGYLPSKIVRFLSFIFAFLFSKPFCDEELKMVFLETEIVVPFSGNRETSIGASSLESTFFFFVCLPNSFPSL